MHHHGVIFATIDALRSGLVDSEVFIGLYETLFTEQTHSALCRHLAIPEQTPDLTHKVNASQATAEVPTGRAATPWPALRSFGHSGAGPLSGSCD